MDSDWHRKLMVALIETLEDHWRDQPRIYVSGNLLVYYEQGNRRRRVSPDVFVVRGVANHLRPNFLVWEERRGPQVVIELTSSKTRREDLRTKFALYQDTLKVREYFLFDPYGDYLDPPLRGYRLRQGQYRPLRAVQGRLPSQVLGLHLERDGEALRLWNPATDSWLPTQEERYQQGAPVRRQAEKRTREELQARQQAKERAQQATHARQQAEAEGERLREELARLRESLGKNDT
jgi:Uma2 family endonuclease